MATRTSSQSGNWNDTATWGGAAAPGIGDIAVIGTAAHVVTVTATQEVGDDVGIGISLVGSLVVNAPLTVRVGTNALAVSQQRTSSVTISRVGSNTGSFTFNPASGVTPHWDCVNTGSGTPAITITGEAGDLVPIATSLARSGNRAYFNFALGAGTWSPTLTWTDFSMTDIGGTGTTTATEAIDYEGAPSSNVTWTRGRFVTIGRMRFNFPDDNITFNVQNCDWRAGRNTEWLTVIAGTALTSGVRQMVGCTFYDASTIRSVTLWAKNFKMTDSVGVNLRVVSEINDENNQFSRNLNMHNVAATGGVLACSSDAGHVVEDSLYLSELDNPHVISIVNDPRGGAPSIIRRNVSDGFGFVGADAGDVILPAGVCTIQQNLFVNRAGTLVSILNTTVRATIRQNTTVGLSTHANLDENGFGSTDTVVRMSSNLFVGHDTGVLADTVIAQAVFNLDYNAWWAQTNAANVDHPVYGNSYLKAGTWWATGAYGDDNKGQHDRLADPQFSDQGATIVTWYNDTFGSGGTFANVAARVIELNGTAANGTGATFDTRCTRAAIVAYYYDAFTPHNSVLYQAGDPDDGSPDIGAVPVIPPPPPPQFTYPRNARFRKLAIGADL